MCLTADFNRTKRYRKCGTSKIVCYKVLIPKLTWHGNRISRRIYSPYLNRRWQPGFNHADKKEVLRYNEQDINHGIHVYLPRAKSLANGLAYRKCGKVVKVICDKKDLIGVDRNLETAAFSKVYLMKSEYDKAMQRRM
jgi:hypothetical protein